MKLKYYFSITAGLISTAVVAYSLLAPVWGFEGADKIFSTGSIIVMVLSLILSVFTGEKIAHNNSPEGMLQSTQDGSVFDVEGSSAVIEEKIDEENSY